METDREISLPIAITSALEKKYAAALRLFAAVEHAATLVTSLVQHLNAVIVVIAHNDISFVVEIAKLRKLEFVEGLQEKQPVTGSWASYLLHR